MLEPTSTLADSHLTLASSATSFLRITFRAFQPFRRASFGVVLGLTILTSCPDLNSRLMPPGPGNVPPTALTEINVNTTLDTVDAKAGDFVCADARGQCSLRAAIMESNDATGVQTIKLPAGTYNLTLAGAGEDDSKTGDLDIISELILNGTDMASTIVNANGLDRAFQIPEGGIYSKGFPVRVSNLTVRSGTVSGQGGGWTVEQSGVDLTMRNVTFEGNSSTIVGGGLTMSSSGSTLNLNNVYFNNNTTAGDGGGLYINAGTAVITNSSFTGNSARGLENRNRKTGGGGIFNGGTLELSDSILSANTAPNALGGGLFTNGIATVKRSSISKNVAKVCGGGAAIDGGALTIDSSSVTENSAIDGAGICSEIGPMTLTNATITKNRASGVGGGILARYADVSVTHSTLAENTAIKAIGLDLYNDSSAVYTVRASVLASTGGSVCAQNGGGTNGFVSTGANVVADASCVFSSTNDLQSSSAKLSALSALSNRVFSVMIPAATSPAIDRVPASLCVTLDARGVTRPQGASCDAGAVERSSTDP